MNQLFVWKATTETVRMLAAAAAAVPARTQGGNTRLRDTDVRSFPTDRRKK